MRVPVPRHQVCSAMAVAAVTALLAAGCGGFPSIGNQSGNQNGDAQALKWVQCLNQHGAPAHASSHSIEVPGPDDPGGPSQQQVDAAEQACKQYQPADGGSGSRPSSGQQLDQNATYVQCLNQHGVPAQLADNGRAVRVGGPNEDPNKEQQADQACEKYAPGSIRAVPGGGS